MTLLRVRDLRIGYGAREVLRGVSLEVAAGEGVALLGENGAGKTTFIRALMAFHRPWSGTVEIDGRSTAGLLPEDLAGTVGYLFQRPEDQLFRRSVRDDVAFGPTVLGWEPARTARAVDAVLEELALATVADHHPYDLSLPRRRLAALAGVLVADPRLLLLDEPTAALDRGGRELVERAIGSRTARGVAVIAVTHDVTFAAEALTRGVVLAEGRVAEDAPLDTLLGRAGGPPLPPAAELLRTLEVVPASLRRSDLASALAARCRALR